MSENRIKNPWIETINQRDRISPEAQSALEKELSRHELEKGQLLFREGQVCHRLYFIEQGSVRGFCHSNGKEVTHWFGFESDFVTSFQSFITQTPGKEYLQTLEPSVFWSISRDALYRLYDKYSEIERLGRITCEQYYIRLEERYRSTQFSIASERYQKLLTESRHIIQRISLGHIASYLGISQETLSRIRANFAIS